MTWKDSFWSFLIYTGLNFPVLYLRNWHDGKLHFDLHYMIRDALMAIALGLMVAGLQELRRGGHEMARRIFWKCSLIWVAISIDLACVVIACKGTAADLAMDYFLDLSLVFVAIPFPLSLYLNRIKAKSILQPTTNHAS